MNTRELEERFLEEGCNPHNYCIGVPQAPISDIYCLTSFDGEWRVYYTERGLDSPPIFVSRDEAEACEFYYREISNMRHSHMVGFFRSLERAAELKAKLEGEGLHPYADRIPYDGWRYRVFVIGKEVFRTRELLGPTWLED